MSECSKHKRPGEALAWFTDDHLTDKSATTYDKAVADRWKEKGWPAHALYDQSALKALITENERLSQFEEAHTIWLEKTEWVQDSAQALDLGRHRADVLRSRIDQLKAENELLRRLVSDTGLELRKASSWICREVEAGTQSATHWAIRLREKAGLIDAAIGKGEQS